MKVKKLENLGDKIGLKDCKESSFSTVISLKTNHEIVKLYQDTLSNKQHDISQPLSQPMSDL